MVKMRQIEIQGIAQPCSQLVMGSMMLTSDNMEFSGALLDHFAAIGGNTIDTAHVYGPKTAQAVGIWMNERNNRESMIIIGKGAHPNAQGPRVTNDAIEQDLLESLERLRTGYVDIYMLHRDDLRQPVASILEALNEQIEAGRCRALGVSNWTTARIQEANEYAASHGLTGFACNSPNLSLAKPNEPRWAGCISADADYVAWHERAQLPLMSWSSQAGGFFTGRFAPDKLDDPEAVRVYYNEANWERLRRATLLGEAKGVSANHIALAYVLHQPFPTCAIIGPNRVEEIHSSAGAISVSLSKREIDWLDLSIDTLD